MAVLTVTNNPFLGQKKKHKSEFFIGKFSCFGVVFFLFFFFTIFEKLCFRNACQILSWPYKWNF